MIFTLNYKTWRSGSSGMYRVGHGPTEMLNKEGYMCCLGQFAKSSGVPSHVLMNTGTPASAQHRMGRDSKPFCDAFVMKGSVDAWANTKLAQQLMEINDDSWLTADERIAEIRKELKKHGHTLRVINRPKVSV